MAKSRKRERFLFWLYPDTDSEIISMIDYLKGLKGYSFVQAIRDGLSLIVDLRRGNIDVLFELFPHLRDKLRSDNGDSDSGNLKRDIERLERLILQQTSQESQTAIMQPVGIKALQGQHKTMSLPIDDDSEDDDNLLEVTKAVGNSNANERFLKAMLDLQQPQQ